MVTICATLVNSGHTDTDRQLILIAQLAELKSPVHCHLLVWLGRFHAFHLKREYANFDTVHILDKSFLKCILLQNSGGSNTYIMKTSY